METNTSIKNFFPYLVVKRKTENHGNRMYSVKKERTVFNRPHVGIKLLLCERTSEISTDTMSNSCFSTENIMKGLERKFHHGNLINISEILSGKNRIHHNNDNIENKKKKDRIINGEEHSLHKESSMHQSQNTTHYLVQSTQATRKRNISQNREIRENRVIFSDLFRFISCENDGSLIRTNAVSMLAFSLSSLAEAVAGNIDVCVCVCVCMCVRE